MLKWILNQNTSGRWESLNLTPEMLECIIMVLFDIWPQIQNTSFYSFIDIQHSNASIYTSFNHRQIEFKQFQLQNIYVCRTYLLISLLYLSCIVFGWKAILEGRTTRNFQNIFSCLVQTFRDMGSEMEMAKISPPSILAISCSVSVVLFEGRGPLIEGNLLLFRETHTQTHTQTHRHNHTHTDIDTHTHTTSQSHTHTHTHTHTYS